MTLRDDASAIWQAGVKAVDSSTAVQQQIKVHGDIIRIAGIELNLSSIGRFEIVGAGKAGAGMAHGIESAMLSSIDPSRISGWINVPADCAGPLKSLCLHPARPAGINEPTAACVEGTNEILRRVALLSDNDVCIVLISGGASALLCSPVPEISLQDKLTVTRLLARSGAPIRELNLVRTQLSQVKGGRLAAACKAGVVIALIISDVIGDPLDVIGSGPTTNSPSQARLALTALSDRGLLADTPKSVIDFLQWRTEQKEPDQRSFDHVTNVVVASNSIAVDAAAEKAKQLGYHVVSLGSANAGDAATEGRNLFQLMKSLHSPHSSTTSKAICVLSGGEPTVTLGSTQLMATHSVGKGGRNQELVLAAITAFQNPDDWMNMLILSGGTDGEDGPTDAAGAFADSELLSEIVKHKLQPANFLERHDSYSFFESVGGLLKTGPTHTNVMDLRIGLVRRAESPAF